MISKVEKEIYYAENPITKKLEIVDWPEAEILTGEKLLKLYWSNGSQRYVSIPGASLFVVDENCQLKLID